MLSEYAVEPEAIGSDWRTFKDLIDRFGADKGRLISRLPAKWKKKVIKAAKEAGVPDVRMSRIIERLSHSKHKVVDFNRDYDYEADWIGNALREHGTRPFKAIICGAGKAASAEAMEPDDCSDAHPLFRATTSCDVTRTADEIADALHTMTAVSKKSTSLIRISTSDRRREIILPRWSHCLLGLRGLRVRRKPSEFISVTTTLAHRRRSLLETDRLRSQACCLLAIASNSMPGRKN